MSFRKIFNYLLVVICTLFITVQVKANFTSKDSLDCVTSIDGQALTYDNTGLYDSNGVPMYCQHKTSENKTVFCLNKGLEYLGSVPFSLTKTITGKGHACGVLKAYEEGLISIPAGQPANTTYYFDEQMDITKQYNIQQKIWNNSSNDSCTSTTSTGTTGTLNIVQEKVTVTKDEKGDSYYIAVIDVSSTGLDGGKYTIASASNPLKNYGLIYDENGNQLNIGSTTASSKLTIKIPTNKIVPKKDNKTISQDSYELILTGKYTIKTTSIVPIIQTFSCTLNQCQNSNKYQDLGRIGLKRTVTSTTKTIEDKVVVEYRPWGLLNVWKLDGSKVSNNQLNGARFKLLDSAGNPAKDIDGKEYGELITGDSGRNGYIGFDKLPYGEYTLVEVAPPAGFELAAEAKETKIIVDYNTERLFIYNNSPKIKITKKDITNENEIAGAHIIITQEKDGEEIVAAEFDSNGQVKILSLGVGKYKLVETVAPNGYELIDNEFEFEILEGGVVKLIGKNNEYIKTNKDTITLYNEPRKVVISKQDITSKEELKGAHIVITDINGKIVEEFDTTEEAHKFTLDPGKYTLTETIAPDGYEKVETVFEFEVLADKSVKLLGEESNYITSDDNKIILYNELVTIPDTAKSTTIFMIIGCILLVSGITVMCIPSIKEKIQRKNI